MDDPVPTSPSSHPLLDRPAWQTMYDGSLSTLLGEHLARLFRMALGKYKNTNDHPYSIIFIRRGDWRGHPDPQASGFSIRAWDGPVYWYSGHEEVDAMMAALRIVAGLPRAKNDPFPADAEWAAPAQWRAEREAYWQARGGVLPHGLKVNIED